MIKLEYTFTVYKNFLNPVLGNRETNQTGFFSFIMAFESKIRGYVENVFFLLLGRAATPFKKEIFNKSTPIKILIARQGNKQAAQRHKIRSVAFYLRDQFPFF